MLLFNARTLTSPYCITTAKRHKSNGHDLGPLQFQQAANSLRWSRNGLASHAHTGYINTVVTSRYSAKPSPTSSHIVKKKNHSPFPSNPPPRSVTSFMDDCCQCLIKCNRN